MIVEWANQRVRDYINSGAAARLQLGSVLLSPPSSSSTAPMLLRHRSASTVSLPSTGVHSITSLADPRLCDSIFLLNLLAAVSSSSTVGDQMGSLERDSAQVKWDLVTSGRSNEECMQNARYAISLARMLGALVFCLPEDIVQVKPKMIMVFIASLLALESRRESEAARSRNLEAMHLRERKIDESCLDDV